MNNLSTFLLKNEKIEDIRDDMHTTKLWAETFWGRRDRHKNREDPEIAFVSKYNPIKILEIGSAYGRFTSKLRAKLPSAKIHGIEICGFFDIYQKKFCLKNNGADKLIYDNFLETEQLDTYDMIILPMNTLPSFPIIKIPELLEKIRLLLNPKGVLIFSNYSLTEETFDNFYAKINKPSFTGDLIIEDDYRITAEYITYEISKTEYGAFIRDYASLNRFDKEYRLVERKLFKIQNHFILDNAMIKLLEDTNFKILENEISGHSRIYVATRVY